MGCGSKKNNKNCGSVNSAGSPNNGHSTLSKLVFLVPGKKLAEIDALEVGSTHGFVATGVMAHEGYQMPCQFPRRMIMFLSD